MATSKPPIQQNDISKRPFVLSGLDLSAEIPHADRAGAHVTAPRRSSIPQNKALRIGSRRLRRYINSVLGDNPIASKATPLPQDRFPGPTHRRLQADYFVPLSHLPSDVTFQSWSSDQELRARLSDRHAPQSRNITTAASVISNRHKLKSLSGMRAIMSRSSPAIRHFVFEIDRSIRVFVTGGALSLLHTHRATALEIEAAQSEQIPIVEGEYGFIPNINAVPILEDDLEEIQLPSGLFRDPGREMDMPSDDDTVLSSLMDAETSMPALAHRSARTFSTISARRPSVAYNGNEMDLGNDTDAEGDRLARAYAAVAGLGATVPNVDLSPNGFPQLCLFSTAETDSQGAFKRFLVHKVATYYGIHTWSATAMRPSETGNGGGHQNNSDRMDSSPPPVAGETIQLERWRSAYVSLDEDAPIMEAMLPSLVSVFDQAANRTSETATDNSAVIDAMQPFLPLPLEHVFA